MTAFWSRGPPSLRRHPGRFVGKRETELKRLPPDPAYQRQTKAGAVYPDFVTKLRVVEGALHDRLEPSRFSGKNGLGRFMVRRFMVRRFMVWRFMVRRTTIRKRIRDGSPKTKA
jgi:hypothetical protein